MIEVKQGVPGVNASDPTSYREFWAYYLSQHLHPMTRRVHAAGTVTAMVTGVTALARGKWRLFFGSPLLAYGPAFATHYVWEGNSPVVLNKGKPIWAARADLEMMLKVLTGRIGLEAAAIREGLGFMPTETTIADHERTLRQAA